MDSVSECLLILSVWERTKRAFIFLSLILFLFLYRSVFFLFLCWSFLTRVNLVSLGCCCGCFAPMRIRKSQTRFSSFSLSDPHLTNRLPPALVQLAVDAAPKAEEAPLSLDRCRPSDHPLLPIGKLSNGCDDPSGEGGAHRPQQRNKQEPLVSEKRYYCLFLFIFSKK